MTDGLATYFETFSYKNTQLPDFIHHLSEAAKKAGHTNDLEAWTDTWLKTAGCCYIWHDIKEENGKITKFTVNQKVHENGDGNRLRVQKYQTAFFDENMKIIKVVDVLLKDDQESFDMTELEGTDAPYAMFINYGNHGFGKFIIDPKSINGLEEKLNLIEDSLVRKHVYSTIDDMLIKNEISGVRAL